MESNYADGEGIGADGEKIKSDGKSDDVLGASGKMPGRIVADGKKRRKKVEEKCHGCSPITGRASIKRGHRNA